jgi:hypothetical protein
MGVDARIILKYILKTKNMCVLIELIWLRKEPVVGSYKNGNEILVLNSLQNFLSR